MLEQLFQRQSIACQLSPRLITHSIGTQAIHHLLIHSGAVLVLKWSTGIHDNPHPSQFIHCPIVCQLAARAATMALTLHYFYNGHRNAKEPQDCI